MLIYVSHRCKDKEFDIERAKKIMHNLQVHDLANCYICPLLTFSHLNPFELAYTSEMDLRLDLLSVCDRLLVASDYIDDDINKEIEFAELVGMEVDYLD